MKKRGKKLLAIILAASMTLGQNGTLTSAQENAAERIESVTFNAQAEDEPDLLSEEVTSATQEDEEQQGNDDTDQGDNESGGDTGGDNNGDGDTPGGNDNNPGAIPIVDPINPTPSGEEPTDEEPSGEETPSGDKDQFTTPDGETTPEGNKNNTTPDNSQGDETTEGQMTFEQVKTQLENGQNVALNADIIIPANDQIVIENTATVSLDLMHHTITVGSGRDSAPIVVNGNLTVNDTVPDESNNNNNSAETNTKQEEENQGTETDDNVFDTGDGEDLNNGSDEEIKTDDSNSSEETEEKPSEEPEKEPETPVEPEDPDESQEANFEVENPNVVSATDGGNSSGVITGSDHGVFALGANANLTIKGGTITNTIGDSVIRVNGTGTTTSLAGGVFCNNGSSEIDGSVYYTAYTNNKSTLNISGGVEIKNNTGKSGGAIWVAAADVNISGGEISGNSAAQDGGAIYAEGGINPNATNYGVSITVRENADLFGNSANENGGAICATQNPTVTISGGNISGNTAENGGGIYIAQGYYSGMPGYDENYRSLNVENGNINGNKANGNGGGIYTSGCAKMQITGGAISSNSSEINGGGIYTKDDTILNMSGGTVTGNTAKCNESTDGGYWTGGGGICTDENTDFTLSAGSITGNHTEGGGGGAGIRIMGINCKFTMTGGAVNGNKVSEDNSASYGAEGGGISVAAGIATLSGGEIKDNSAWTESWGGGGVFCSDKAVLTIINARITENAAGGFGGGIAGCSTGRIFVFGTSTEGENSSVDSAFYNNSAEGVYLSGSNSAKDADHVYARNNTVFMNNGYADYFCALNSVVDKKMYGETPKWSGSVDGVPVSEVDEAMLTSYIASYMMGLTVSEEYNAVYSQKSYSLEISGNRSHTHGGGILCNGYLICGNRSEIELGSRLELDLGKKMQDSNGKTLEDALKTNTFNFEVYQKHHFTTFS